MNTHKRQQPGARYTPLLTRARATEQAALRALSEAQQRFCQEKNKLAQLRNYPNESTQSAQAHSASTLINRNAFLSRLRQAIQLQEDQLGKAEQMIKKARNHWVNAHNDTQRYEQLIANEASRARRHAARLEQKELDEIASRTHFHMPHRV
ncbi:MAG: flagellar export protein FliJ [Salinisphaeraceae bacterium]|nr:flagellar export protein FliJ [Salinisphaeraceae bacterium]